MSIDYYLAGKKNKRLFDIGDLRCSLYLWQHLPPAIADEALRGSFVEVCVDWMRTSLHEHQEWYYPGEHSEDGWLRWARNCAEAVFSFAQEEDWDVVVVNDCDDSLDEVASKDGKRWPVTHTVYTKHNDGPGCRAIDDDPYYRDDEGA